MLFSAKRYDVFSKTICCFFGDEVFSIPSTVTLVTAKNKTRRTGARIHARVRTPSANTQPSPHPIKSNQSTSPPFRIPLIKTFITKKYSSAMKRPSTNHSSKPILICTTFTSISASKDDKTRYRQRKNGTNMPFFHSLGLFPPIY